ncbi:unnamed protein product [Soboliphyme baturini]|uniref:G_PROTEIN_RECEP_F1_2 domain-containing protein n=1 Tax=Soboliphyme baturini TaxID=241478 RepID=A0A183IYT3_9BILA|nr:unnamed protein product [Soboliphyme baturini]
MACLMVDDYDYEIFEVTNTSQCNCSDPAFWYNELCNCDYPQAPPSPLYDALPLGMWYGVVFVLGALGNSMVIAVVSIYKRMRSLTNIFLASLSTADLLIILFCIPVQYMKYLSYSWFLGKFLCIWFHYVQLFTMICSVLTLTVISFERYMAVAFPMKIIWLRSTCRARKTVLIIWLLSAILATPLIFGQVTRLPIQFRVIHKKIFVLYQFLLLYLIPLATMAVCYALLVRVLYFSNRDPFLGITPAPDSANHSMNTTLLNSKRNIQKIVQMLVAVVSLFIICWTPYLVDEFLVAFGYLCHTSPTETLKYMRMTFAIMKFSNSCVNPIVYAFMSRHFRRTFVSVCGNVCCFKRHWKNSALSLKRHSQMEINSVLQK